MPSSRRASSAERSPEVASARGVSVGCCEGDEEVDELAAERTRGVGRLVEDLKGQWCGEGRRRVVRARSVASRAVMGGDG